MTAMGLAEAIRDKVIELGLDPVGITGADPIEPPHVCRLKAWLDAGCAGQMRSMHRHLNKRVDPGQLLPGAKSVIVAGLPYKPPPCPPHRWVWQVGWHSMPCTRTTMDF